MNQLDYLPKGSTWQSILADLKASGLTYKDIASKCGCLLSTISKLASATSTGDPKYGLGYHILQLHAEHCPPKRKARK